MIMHGYVIICRPITKAVIIVDIFGLILDQ